MNRVIKVSIAYICVVLGLSSGTANADFSGAYDIKNWTVGEGVDTSKAPSSVTLYDHGVPRDQSGSSFFTIATVAESNVSFNWETHIDPTSGRQFEFLLNGIDRLLATTANGPYSGSFSVHVDAGDILRFEVCCSEHFPVAFSTTISNFNVTSVPEPESYAMLLTGLSLFGFMARRKSKARQSIGRAIKPA